MTSATHRHRWNKAGRQPLGTIRTCESCGRAQVKQTMATGGSNWQEPAWLAQPDPEPERSLAELRERGMTTDPIENKCYCCETWMPHAEAVRLADEMDALDEDACMAVAERLGLFHCQSLDEQEFLSDGRVVICRACLEGETPYLPSLGR